MKGFIRANRGGLLFHFGNIVRPLREYDVIFRVKGVGIGKEQFSSLKSVSVIRKGEEGKGKRKKRKKIAKEKETNSEMIGMSLTARKVTKLKRSALLGNNSDKSSATSEGRGSSERIGCNAG